MNDDDDLTLKLLEKERTLDQILHAARKKDDAIARSKIMNGESNDYVVRKVRVNQSLDCQEILHLQDKKNAINVGMKNTSFIRMPCCFKNMQFLQKEREQCKYVF